MRSIDCLGDFCPIPVLKLKEQLKTMKSQDSVKIISDHSCVVESIHANFSKKKVSVTELEVCPGIWEITIIKL